MIDIWESSIGNYLGTLLVISTSVKFSKSQKVQQDKKALIVHISFSNSLIIHHVKTKKITTVKEVWIPGLN